MIKILGYYEKFVTVVENRTSLTVSSLKHFAPYAISVWACREYEKEELVLKSLPENCSVVSSLLRVRTIQLRTFINLQSTTWYSELNLIIYIFLDL